MDNLTPTQIIAVRLLCFLIPVGVLMLGPKDALLRRLWTGKTPRMWHLETIAVMICVAFVILLFGNSPVEWVGFAALSLAHGRNSIMFRLSEEQEKSTPLDPHHVECGRWIPVYFFGSELCWAAYFLLHRSWAALAGVAIFVSYGQWRRWYGKWKQTNFKELAIDPEKIAPAQVLVKVSRDAKPLSYADILKAPREMRANSQPAEEIPCASCGRLGRCYVFGEGPRLPYFCVQCRDKAARTLLDLPKP